MKKNKFIKSTIILIIGGFITKLLGMVIKVTMTRLLGTEGIGLYMMIIPTFSLLIAFAQLGLPVAISKLVAEDSKNNKNLIFSSIPITLSINILIIFVLLFSSRYISNNLLHDSRLYYALISMGFVLPFISISSILRGYFFGKQRMLPHVISNIVEDVVRLIILTLGIPIFLLKGIEFAVAFIILSIIISELTSIFIFIFFLPKKINLTKDDLKPHNIPDILRISLPTTGSRLIGNIGYFLEPIILTSVLLSLGYSNSFVISEYGIINGYVMPLLLLPSFFASAVSQALIPVVSKSYSSKNYKHTKEKIIQAMLISLIIGIPITLFFCFAPELSLKLIYNTTEGVEYLKVLAPLFLLLYIQTPLVSSLQAMGKAKSALYTTLISVLLRTLTLFLFSYLKIGLWGLIISISLNIIFVTISDFNIVFKTLKIKIKN
ncbi:MAG: oligosaccharide flippase family protein [Bacilli bacterium]|nr:oligosaccharide flippase family protein [Bacilli bacterium]MDD4808417.1 oligosaccharide flippase family protein [Bacilli bacterium]